MDNYYASMLAISALLLVDLAVTCAIVTARALIVKISAALFSLIVPILMSIAAAGAVARRNYAGEPPVSGSTFFFIAYGALAAACLALIIQGIVRAKAGSVALGVLVMAVTIFFLWIAYDLKHTTWKIGG